MTMREFTEGEWTYAMSTAWTWTATHVTGRVLTADTVTDLRRAVYEASRTNNPQITVVSGPGRALSARRYTKAFAA